MSQYLRPTSKPNAKPKRPPAAAVKWPLALPAELTQARRFGKARSAQSSALLEDYVELIADLLASTGEARPTDIARRLGVSHATAIKTIARLKRELEVTRSKLSRTQTALEIMGKARELLEEISRSEPDEPDAPAWPLVPPAPAPPLESSSLPQPTRAMPALSATTASRPVSFFISFLRIT